MGRTICFLILLTIGAYSRELKRVVRFEQVNITYQDSNYIDLVIKLKKLDRKINSLNVTLNIKKDISYIKNSFIIYKFADNVYKPTALRYSGNHCNILNSLYDKHNLDRIKIFENFCIKCPVKKGFYYINNFDGNGLPSLTLPLWKTKTEFVIESDDTLLLKTYVIAEVIDL